MRSEKKFGLSKMQSGKAVMAIMAIAIPQTVLAQSTTPTGNALSGVVEGEAQVPEEVIIVTGTRVEGRSVRTSSSPIDILTSESLTRTAEIELGQAIQRVAPSFNLPQATVGATAAVRAATLRGLAPDQTLVLIDGRRRHASSVINTNNSIGRGSVSTDFSLIPIAAVERIEVLRSGAAAQYGSDAIAGVINVILRTEPSGFAIEAKGSKAQRAGGEDASLSMRAGLPLNGGGSVTITGELSTTGKTNNALPNLNGTPTSNPNFGRVTAQFGDPDTQTGLLAIKAVAPLGGAEVYAHATAGWREVKAPGFFRDPLGAGGPSAASDNRLVFPAGFLPLGVTRQLDGEAYVGLRGDLAEWSWDMSIGLGSNKYDQVLDPGVNGSLGATSPTRFDVGGFRSTQLQMEATASRRYPVLAGLDISGGLAHRKEWFAIRAGDAASRLGSGSDPQRGLDPIVPVDESRNSFAGFVDGSLAFTKDIRVEGSARWEHYSDFGETVTGRAAFHGGITKGLSIRGSISTGFRAPSLQQTFYTTVNRRIDQNTGAQTVVGTYPVDAPAAFAVGALPLKPERSRQLGLGVVIEPLPGLVATIDWFDTSVEDRITLSEQLSALGASPGAIAVRQSLATAGIRGVDAISFFTNAVDTTTRGIEVSTSYRAAIGSANMTVTGGYARFTTKIDRIRANDRVPQLPLLAQRSLTLLAGSQPGEKASLDLNLERGAINLSALATYYGGYTVSFGEEIAIGPEVIVDLGVSLRIKKNLRFALRVQNIFDEYPDELARAARIQGARIRSFGLRYPEETPFGNTGRVFSMGVSAEF